MQLVDGFVEKSAEQGEAPSPDLGRAGPGDHLVVGDGRFAEEVARILRVQDRGLMS